MRLENEETFNSSYINPLNAELNPICHLLPLLAAHHIFHISRIRVNTKTLSGLCKVQFQFQVTDYDLR